MTWLYSPCGAEVQKLGNTNRLTASIQARYNRRPTGGLPSSAFRGRNSPTAATLLEKSQSLASPSQVNTARDASRGPRALNDDNPRCVIGTAGQASRARRKSLLKKSLVEAAGIEPASRSISAKASTRVFGLLESHPNAPNRRGAFRASQELGLVLGIPGVDPRRSGFVGQLLGLSGKGPQPVLRVLTQQGRDCSRHFKFWSAFNVAC